MNSSLMLILLSQRDFGIRRNCGRRISRCHLAYQIVLGSSQDVSNSRLFVLLETTEKVIADYAFRIGKGGILLRIMALLLHLTNLCNARCEHCAYHCGPQAHGVMDVKEAEAYLQQAVEAGAEILCISGGEPLLFPETVSKIAKIASIYGMRNVWVFTNGHWAVDSEKARRTLMRLKKAGVSKLCVGADGFHQPFVPTSCVREAITVASKLGIELVLDTRIMGKALQDDNPVNKVTVQMLHELGDLRNIETWRGSPLYIGRAAEILPKRIQIEPYFLGGQCTGPWAGGSWVNPIGVDVDLYGEVTLCPGVSIGNAKKRQLAEILSDYSPSRHKIIRELSAGGPKGLWRIAIDSGYKSLPGYLSACHLCYDVRKFIRSDYAAELMPSSCYEELS
jgi:hypothetical protein